jgi:ABC-type antimicrobial peptide transport system permease subunit
MTLVVRAGAVRPEQLLPAVRRVLAELDPGVPVTDARPMAAVVARSMARRSFATLLLAAASAVALLLSAVGIYGVVSYLVAQRRAEIGIRLALGAGRGAVGRLVVLQSVRLAAAGVGLGLAAALAATRALRSLLYEVSPTDPATLGAAALLLVLLAAAAGWVPARRAMRVDPVEALRHE